MCVYIFFSLNLISLRIYSMDILKEVTQNICIKVLHCNTDFNI